MAHIYKIPASAPPKISVGAFLFFPCMYIYINRRINNKTKKVKMQQYYFEIKMYIYEYVYIYIYICVCVCVCVYLRI